MKNLKWILALFALAGFALNADHHRGRGKKGPGMMHGKMLEMMDTDKDGKVTKQEWQAHHEQRFTEMDTNKDGAITAEEVKAHHEMMRKKHQEMCPDCAQKGKGKKRKRPKMDDDDDQG